MDTKWSLKPNPKYISARDKLAVIAEKYADQLVPVTDDSDEVRKANWSRTFHAECNRLVGIHLFKKRKASKKEG